MIIIMIDGSQKRNCEGGVWTLEFARFWKAQQGKKRLQRTQKGVFLRTVAEFCVLWINFRLFA